LLESGGYRVQRAVNAAQAIAFLEEFNEPVHLLLTDVLMPTMSGGVLSTHVKTLRPYLNVLLMSGYAGDLVTRCGGIKPELQLLEKPFTRRKLLSMVDTEIHDSRSKRKDA